MAVSRRIIFLGFVLYLSACGTKEVTFQPHATPFATDRRGVPTLGECAGLPAVSVAALGKDIACIGLIDNELIFPRGVVAWGNDIIVADKGSTLQQRTAGATNGRIVRYRRTPQGYVRSTIIEGLDNPSGLSLGSYQIYISTPTAILRFNPDAPVASASLKTVISDLPLHGWHYISGVYATDDALYVTVPSASDHCESQPQSQNPRLPFPCPEVAAKSPAKVTAAIRRYSIAKDGSVSGDFSVIARGLRDALAVLQTPDAQHLLAADNGWDNIDTRSQQLDPARVPLDELNVISLAASEVELQTSFGWPYCYHQNLNDVAITPGYESAPVDCSSHLPAHLTFAAHSAPLALLYQNNRLLVNLHGYSDQGRRTLSISLDPSGIPVGEPEIFIDWDYRQTLGYLVGRPFGLANYGSNLLVTDDWNHALLLVKMGSDEDEERNN